ncbi:RipA family octameric membrane protein [Actinokineospora sp. NPDC004072]
MPFGPRKRPSPGSRRPFVQFFTAIAAIIATAYAFIRWRADNTHGGKSSLHAPVGNKPSVDDQRFYAFDEYKMYYETTEKVTEHRQTTNRWNYSVAIALLVAIALMFKWAADKPGNLIVGLIGVVSLCTLAVIFCFLWLNEIESFKSLNGAKFEVLNDMAPNVRFEDVEATSYEPFRREWERLTKSKGAKSIKLFGGRVALKSSGPELFFPRAFAVLFMAIGAVMVTAVTLGWGQGSRPFSPFATTPPSSSVTVNPTPGPPSTSIVPSSSPVSPTP